MLSNDTPAKGMVFVLVITIVVTGFLLILSIWSSEPTNFNACIEAGYPVVTNEENQQQCIINSRVFTKKED